MRTVNIFGKTFEFHRQHKTSKDFCCYPVRWPFQGVISMEVRDGKVRRIFWYLYPFGTTSYEARLDNGRGRCRGLRLRSAR